MLGQFFNRITERKFRDRPGPGKGLLGKSGCGRSEGSRPRPCHQLRSKAPGAYVRESVGQNSGQDMFGIACVLGG